MEVSEGRETSEDGRGKGGKSVVMKKWRKREMEESEMEKRKCEEMKRVERGQTMKHIRWKGGERVLTKVDRGRRNEGRY